MAGGEKRTAIAGNNRRGARPAAVKSGKAKNDRRYQENLKCSVDVARNRTNDDDMQPVTKVMQAKFERVEKSKSVTTQSGQESRRDVRTQACSKWMSDVAALGLRGIRKEFISSVKPFVPNGPSEAFSEHSEYNRYDDVHCLDQSRVKIKDNPDGDDYIHASYVEVRKDLVYICAQGPMENTVSHFWRMIMQEGTKVVLQLCQLMEDGKEKCNEYYPAEGSEWKSYGRVQVRVTERNSSLSGMKKVTKSKMFVRSDSDKEKVHELVHIYYFGWPDHSVAESAATCKEVRNLVHRCYEKKPIVAHCSAGIGRTGTFVMIELVCHRLLDLCDSEFKTSDLVKVLREQRMSAIQNDQQYCFVFRAVVEVLLAEDALVKSPDVVKFIEDYDSLVKRKKAERAKSKR